GDDDLAAAARFHAGADRGEHLAQAARPRQVDTGTAAGIVQVIVGETGNHRLAVEIDRLRAGAGVLPDLGVAADRGEPAAANRNRLRDRETAVDGDDVAVDENRVGRRRTGLNCAKGGDRQQEV